MVRMAVAPATPEGEVGVTVTCARKEEIPLLRARVAGPASMMAAV
jgi:hypothetical protein